MRPPTCACWHRRCDELPRFLIADDANGLVTLACADHITPILNVGFSEVHDLRDVLADPVARLRGREELIWALAVNLAYNERERFFSS